MKDDKRYSAAVLALAEIVINQEHGRRSLGFETRLLKGDLILTVHMYTKTHEYLDSVTIYSWQDDRRDRLSHLSEWARNPKRSYAKAALKAAGFGS